MYKSLANRYLSFWHSKLPPLLVIIYYILSYSLSPVTSCFYYILLFLLSSLGFGVLGYVINDIADKHENHLQGRINFMSALSAIQKFSILLLALFISVLPWYFLYFDIYVIALLATQIIAYFSYSFPPTRFKERGYFGLFMDALYAHIIPALLVAYVFSSIYKLQIQTSFLLQIVFVLFITFTGVRNILIHQIHDFNKDVLAGTDTVATRYGIKKSNQIKNRFFIPIELISYVLLCFLLPGLQLIIGLHLLYVGYVFFRETNYLKHKLQTGEIDYKKYDFISDVVISEFYQKWMPILFLIIAPLSFSIKLSLLLFHSVVFAYNTYLFYFDLQYLYTVVLLQLKYAVWFIYHHLFLRIFFKLYLNAKHILYWYIFTPIKKILSK